MFPPIKTIEKNGRNFVKLYIEDKLARGWTDLESRGSGIKTA